ncbi:hypothetical protein BLOT_002861 [Blomia tropicalis]|nr:hypothetical protein BLOT_002861 [Blomia tropicalis]
MKSIEEIILCSRIKIKMLVKLLLLIVGARMNHANNIYRSIRCKHDFMFHDRVRNPFFPFAISITNSAITHETHDRNWPTIEQEKNNKNNMKKY